MKQAESQPEAKPDDKSSESFKREHAEDETEIWRILFCKTESYQKSNKNQKQNQ